MADSPVAVNRKSGLYVTGSRHHYKRPHAANKPPHYVAEVKILQFVDFTILTFYN